MDLKYCGAKTKTGARCRRKPTRKDNGEVNNGRCRMHGGTNPGSKIGNKNASQHGLYFTTYSKEEQELYHAIELGNVNSEIKLLRIRLYRCLKLENAFTKEEHNLAFGFKLDEIRSKALTEDQIEDGMANIKGETLVEIKRKRPDVEKIINNTITRIDNLERTKFLLEGSAGDTTPHDFANQIRAAALAIELFTNEAK